MKQLVFLGMAAVLLGMGTSTHEEEEKDPTAPPTKIQLTSRIDLRLEGGAVSALAFSPDGRKLVTGGENGDVILWETRQGKRLASLDAHEERIAHLAMDPSGERLATVGKELALWKVEDLSLLQRMPARRGTRVVWSADGKWVAFDEEDGFLVVRDSKTFRSHRRLWRKGGLAPLAFSPLGDRLALESRRGWVTVLEVETGREVERARYESGVAGLGYLPGGELVTALKDGKVTWGAVAVRHSKGVTGLAVSPDGSRIAASGRGGEIHVWDPSGVLVQVYRDSKGEIGCLSFSPDGESFAAGGEDGIVSLRGKGPTLKLKGHASWVESLAFSRDSAHLAVADSKRTLFLDLETLETRRGEGGGALAPGPAGREILQVDAEAITLWDARGGKRLHTTPRKDEGGAVSPVSLSPDGDLIAAFRYLSGVLLHPTRKGRLVRIGGGSHQVFDLAWSPDGTVLATANAWGMQGDLGGLALVDREGKTLRQAMVQGPVSTVAFRPDGGALAWADRKGVHLSDSKNLEEIRTLGVEADWFRFLGDRMAVSHDSETLTFWKLPTFQEIGNYTFPGILAEAIAPDHGHLALSNGRDTQVFRIDSGKDLPPPP